MITPEQFDAVLFDLDGVLTDTARIHATCWKRTFDTFMQECSANGNEASRPFEMDTDYPRYVDGKPRLDGIRDFLGSRGVRLPEGTTDAPPGSKTIYGLGNLKNSLVIEAIESGEVQVYKSSIALVRQLRKTGIKTAVVSSSRNCRAVLHAAGIAELFEVVVDGEVATRLSLPGKPAPDTFLEAARRLAVNPARAVVVEDAISGVQAGRAGRFGLVIGVERESDRGALRKNGADVVVSDLSRMMG